MKSNRTIILILALALLSSCGGSNDEQSVPPPSIGNIIQGDNVLALSVNGSLCSKSYINKPCVSVTVCSPGTKNCQTINDILLDTGSTGLRVFKQALSVPLTQNTKGDLAIAECVQYAGGNSQWGPIKTADVVLGGEPTVTVPIQVIDSTFAITSKECSQPDLGPEDTGFNGILGVSFFAQDCGSTCAQYISNHTYYACSQSGCVPIRLDTKNQVQNPVTLLPNDNNGVILSLPAVPPEGLPYVEGYLILGIDTRPNNKAPKLTTYQASPVGEILTTFDGTLYESFIDSGSNGLFFPPTTANDIPICGEPFIGWFCPAKLTPLTAINMAYNGTSAQRVNFLIGNTNNLATSSNNVFPDTGAPFYGVFDWGLPFFLGRNVYVGYENASSSLGSGLYWAY